MANDICKLVGMKSVWISCDGINHAWCNVYVTNKNGTSYWKGIHATAYAYSLKKSIGISISNENFAEESISKKQLKKYVCKNAQTGWHRVRKRKSKPTTAPTVTTPEPTAAPTSLNLH